MAYLTSCQRSMNHFRNFFLDVVSVFPNISQHHNNQTHTPAIAKVCDRESTPSTNCELREGALGFQRLPFEVSGGQGQERATTPGSIAATSFSARRCWRIMSLHVPLSCNISGASSCVCEPFWASDAVLVRDLCACAPSSHHLYCQGYMSCILWLARKNAGTSIKGQQNQQSPAAGISWTSQQRIWCPDQRPGHAPRAQGSHGRQKRRELNLGLCALSIFVPSGHQSFPCPSRPSWLRWCWHIPWRIHGAGIYANIKGIYWWDPCYHI